MRCGNFEDQREMIAMERIRDAVLAELASSSCSEPFDPKQFQTIVERRLHELLPRLKTTSHLPYSVMIERAILKLSEEGKPSEKDIADFILKEYEDLPLAHESFVSHHLRKLCERCGVVCTNDGRYAFQGNNTEDGGVTTRQGKRKMCRGRGRRGEKRLRVEGTGGKENVAEEIRGGKQSANHEQVEEPEFMVGGTMTELDTEEVFKANHLATEELNKEHGETVEGQAGLVQELQLVVSSEQNEVHDQGTFLEASMLSKPQNELQLLAQHDSREKQGRWRPPNEIMELYSNPEEILLAYFLRLKKLRQKHRGRPHLLAHKGRPKPKTEQIIKRLGLGRPHKPRPDADSSIQQLPWDECVNREEQLPARGRGRPPKSKQVAMTNEDGTVPSNNNKYEKKQMKPRNEYQNKKDQLPAQGRGRPPKSKQVAMRTEDGMGEQKQQLLPSEEYQNKEDQLPARGRGRPPKSKHVAMTNEDGTVPSNNNKYEKKQTQPRNEYQNKKYQLPARGRGRPPKSRQAAMRTEDGMGEQKQQLLPSEEYQNKEEQLPVQGRGRPPKSRQAAMTTEDGTVPSHNKKEQKQRLLPLNKYQKKIEQFPARGRGRPPKSKKVCMTTEDGAVPSNPKLEKDHNKQPLPSKLPFRGRGRPPKSKQDEVTTNDAGRGRPPKSKQDEMTTEDAGRRSPPKSKQDEMTTEDVASSPKSKQDEMTTEDVGRRSPPKSKQDEMTTEDAGRGSPPPKSKQDEIITEDVMVPQVHEHEKEQEQPVKFYIRVKRTTSNLKPKRGRGRPPKSKPDTDTVTENHQVPTTKALPEKLQVQERPPNAKSDDDAVTKNPLARRTEQLRPKPQLRKRPPKLPCRKAGTNP